MPIAIMIAQGVRPSTAAMLTASSSEGMDSRMSTKRITPVSHQPPSPPARTPSAAPPITPIMVDTMPMTSVCRAP